MGMTRREEVPRAGRPEPGTRMFPQRCRDSWWTPGLLPISVLQSLHRFSHELRMPGGAEADVHAGIEEQLVSLESQVESEDERCLVQADLRRVGIILRPGTAGGRGLLAQAADAEPPFAPLSAAADDPAIDAVGAHDQ